MIKHEHTQTTSTNFDKLENRLLTINSTGTYYYFNENLFKPILAYKNKPTLIIATGGSKSTAYFLQIYLESFGIITNVIEPRDYFYKQNVDNYKRLIVISCSANTNGIKEILENFKGEKYLITENKKEELTDTQVVYWSNDDYIDKEKSFISIIPTLAPIMMIIDLIESIGKYHMPQSDILNQINSKLKILLQKSNERIKNINFNFKNENLIQILSGIDTKTACTVLESNLTESGIASTVVHDKGAFCHGRSNLIYQNPTSPIIYLAHTKTKLDEILLEALKEEYPNIFLLHTLDIDNNIFWKELYLILQMYYLSKKISEDRDIDLTMPEYNTKIIQKTYKYRGEM